MISKSKGGDSNESRTLGKCSITYNWRSDTSFTLLNFILLFSSLILYIMNELIFKPQLSFYFFHYYFNDVLAMIIFLSYSNIILHNYKIVNGYILNFKRILISTLVAGLFWEYITPLYRQESTRDLVDIVAYGLGSLIYYIITIKYRRTWKIQLSNI